MPHAIVIALIAFLVSASAVAWLARGRIATLALDEPNARSLHKAPVPRSGGLGLLLGIAAAWIVIAPLLPLAWWLALALIIAISLADDLRGLPAGGRLAAHLLSATFATYALMPSGTQPWLIPVIVIGIGWTVNLYNFMDGSDGLAGGMALIGFSAYATASWLSGSTEFAMLNLAVAMAAGGFLLHNFHPARIFMGDTGAVTLGFLAATLGLIGWQQHDWTWWFPLLVFSPFIADASITLLRRGCSGARVWEAHRDHYYQRLVQLGLGHRGTALAEYALMLACAVTALWALTQQYATQMLALVIVILLYLALAWAIGRAWQKRTADAL